MNPTLCLVMLIMTTLLANDYTKMDSPAGNNDDHLKHPVTLVVLGIAQDAGYPQLNCYKPHCMPAWHNPALKKMATSLAVIDHKNQQKYLFEATPDIRQQMYELQTQAPDDRYTLAGIFLTHAHIGHYTGLMHFGREAAGSQATKVFAMPKMRDFLINNAPWSQLVSLNNISIETLSKDEPKTLTERLSVTPFLVPHRDEFSETVGYRITGPNKTALFIPDIDKWQKWQKDIISEIKAVDYAFLDATFFANGEIPNRDMSEIPHPFVEETMKLLSDLSDRERSKVYFIHFNHSNPLLQDDSEAQKTVKQQGFNMASEGMKLRL